MLLLKYLMYLESTQIDRIIDKKLLKPRLARIHAKQFFNHNLKYVQRLFYGIIKNVRYT